MEEPTNSNEGLGAPSSTVAPPAETSRPKKQSLTKVLPSDRLTAERQIAALRAFAAVAESNEGKAVTNDKAGDVIKMAAATIVVTNAFFCDIGLLSRAEGGFLVSPEAAAFLRAEGGLSPEDAPEKLKPLFEKQWFMQILAPRLRLGPMDISSVQKVIGEECSASKEHLARIDVLIDLLCFVKCLAREGNQVRVLNGGARVAEVSDSKESTAKAPAKREEEQEQEGLEKYTLTLDPKTKRRIILFTPPEITASELNRIQQWLSFQLIVTPQPDA